MVYIDINVIKGKYASYKGQNRLVKYYTYRPQIDLKRSLTVVKRRLMKLDFKYKSAYMNIMVKTHVKTCLEKYVTLQ